MSEDEEAKGRQASHVRNALQATAGPKFPNRIASGGVDAKPGRPALGRVAVPLPSVKSRRVAVKAHFVKTGECAVEAAPLHIRYVQCEGAEKDGSRGWVYGAEGEGDTAAFAKWLENERHQFWLIVSPEDARELDMTAFVRRYMAEVEKDVEHPLQWIAVNHYNTDHPHAHIIIRGIDKDGEQVRMGSGYISHGLRERARDIVTRELGPHTEIELERRRLHEVNGDMVIGLDAEVERLTEHDVVNLRGARWARVNQNLMVARLQHLEAMKLAERQSSCSWRLAPGWQDELRERARSNNIMHRMAQMLGGARSRYEMDRTSDGGHERRRPTVAACTPRSTLNTQTGCARGIW